MIVSDKFLVAVIKTLSLFRVEMGIDFTETDIAYAMSKMPIEMWAKLHMTCVQVYKETLVKGEQFEPEYAFPVWIINAMIAGYLLGMVHVQEEISKAKASTIIH